MTAKPEADWLESVSDWASRLVLILNTKFEKKLFDFGIFNVRKVLHFVDI